MATGTLLTFDQFMDLPDLEGGVRELDEGRVIESKTDFSHGTVQGIASSQLLDYLHRTSADFRLSVNAGFLLAPGTLRAPDVCVVRKSCYEAMEVVRDVLVGAPDLAVEVVSPGDTAVDIDRKVAQYLQAGATAVWVFYPETRHVMIYRRSGETRMVSSGQTFDDPELLPGFSVPVDEFFAGV